jgi:predicted DNA-binding transcriptional regulator AlpA
LNILAYREAVGDAAPHPGPVAVVVEREGKMSVDVECALLDVRKAAALCGMSRTSWYRAESSGKVPRAVRIGGSVRWRRDELLRWIDAGCPARAKWDIIREHKFI